MPPRARPPEGRGEFPRHGDGRGEQAVPIRGAVGHCLARFAATVMSPVTLASGPADGPPRAA